MCKRVIVKLWGSVGLDPKPLSGRPLKGSIFYFCYYYHPIMENQMENQMENEMETREYVGVILGAI